MGTRSGDIDPAVVEFLSSKLNKPVFEVLTILNKKSGVQGVSGVSSDFRDLTNAKKEGNDKARPALETDPFTKFRLRIAKLKFWLFQLTKN